jgi:hypothetical protein
MSVGDKVIISFIDIGDLHYVFFHDDSSRSPLTFYRYWALFLLFIFSAYVGFNLSSNFLVS